MDKIAKLDAEWFRRLRQGDGAVGSDWVAIDRKEHLRSCKAQEGALAGRGNLQACLKVGVQRY